MKSINKVLSLVLCAILLFSMTACNTQSGNEQTTDPTGISVDITELTIGIGESYKVNAKVEGENADNSVIWSSSDSEIASVDENGNVTGIAAGNATVTVTTANGAFSASCDVTVTEDVVEELFRLEYNSGEEAPTVTTVVFYSNHRVSVSSNIAGAYTLAYDTTIRMEDAPVIDAKAGVEATIVPELAELAAMIGLPEVIVLDYNHDISIPGDTIYFEIYGTAPEADPVFLGRFEISSEQVAMLGFDLSTMERVPVEGIALERNTMELIVTSGRLLNCIVTPENATDKSVIWTSSHPSIVSVDENGMIIARKEGQALITATTPDGAYSASCLIVVVPVPVPQSSIEMTFNDNGILDVNSVYVLEGIPLNIVYSTPYHVNEGLLSIDTANYNLEIPYVGAIPLIISHTITVNEDSLTINANASGHDLGNVVLTKEEAEAMGIDLSKTPDPVIPVESITLDSESLQMNVGDEYTLTATVSPSDATDKTVLWASTDESIATVVDGKITAVAPGLVFISASSSDGIQTAACMVSVSAPGGKTMAFALDDTVTVNTNVIVDGVPYPISYTTTYTYVDGVLSIADGSAILMGFIPVTVTHTINSVDDAITVTMTANGTYDAGSYTLTMDDIFTVIM